MTNVPAPANEPEEEDASSDALSGWNRTLQLCVIRLSEAVPPALTTVVIWLCSRR
jgi:hypothetical protein